LIVVDELVSHAIQDSFRKVGVPCTLTAPGSLTLRMAAIIRMKTLNQKSLTDRYYR